MAKKKAVKKHRGLVLGHLERISSAAFDKYKQVITEMVGGRNGIYLDTSHFSQNPFLRLMREKLQSNQE